MPGILLLPSPYGGLEAYYNAVFECIPNGEWFQD